MTFHATVGQSGFSGGRALRGSMTITAASRRAAVAAAHVLLAPAAYESVSVRRVGRDGRTIKPRRDN